MKIVVLTLANDAVCVCARCTRLGGDGGGRGYKPMIEAIRNTWAAEDVEGVKPYYIYGHRAGVDFPSDIQYREVDETYWPNNEKTTVTQKRYPFAIEDCIYSDTPEGRENLYYKTLDGFEWLLENEEFDYLIRPSAGSYIDLHMFREFLESIGIKDNIYAGSTGVYNNEHNHAKSTTQPPTITFASGSGFVVSRNLIEDIVAKRGKVDLVCSPYAEACIGDDVTFAKHFIHDCNAELIPFLKYELTSVAQITSVVKNYMQCYFVHTIDPELHYAVHRAKGLTCKS